MSAPGSGDGAWLEMRGPIPARFCGCWPFLATRRTQAGTGSWRCFPVWAACVLASASGSRPSSRNGRRSGSSSTPSAFANAASSWTHKSPSDSSRSWRARVCVYDTAMAVRLFSAKGAGDDLAAGRIVAADQALYLTASFLIWMVPAYLFLFPAPRTIEPEFFWGIWLAELALLVLLCIVGIGYCLRNCRVEPQRNFLVDFSCLNAPISLTTLAIVWGAFHL